MHSSQESLINFYNPPSTTPVRTKSSHYTADPHLFPLPTHYLLCPHCRHESLIAQFPHRSLTNGSRTTGIHATTTDRTVA